MLVKCDLMPNLWGLMYHIDVYNAIAFIICCIAWFRYNATWSCHLIAMSGAELWVAIAWFCYDVVWS